MCRLLLTDSSPVAVADYELAVAEARLSKRAVQRRGERVTAPVVKRITADLRYAFRHEAERVMDILANAKLPYQPASEAMTPNAELLAQLLMNGIDLTQYQAIMEDCYRGVMPEAMTDAQRMILDMLGKDYRIGPLGETFISGGFKLVRSPAAEQWIRDHAIVFGRKYAATVTAKTNTMIRAQIAEGFEKLEGTFDIAKRIKGVYADCVDYRAEMIARTEAQRAYGEAEVEQAQQMKVPGKYWISSGSEYAAVDVCSDNVDMGVIPVGATFAHGGLSVPAHPNCLCSVGLDIPDDYEIPEEMIAER
jgi:hypothetical protein